MLGLSSKDLFLLLDVTRPAIPDRHHSRRVHLGHLYSRSPHILDTSISSLFKMTTALSPLKSKAFRESPLPPTELKSHGEIRFLHPGYPAPTNTLLYLPRVDPTSTDTFGVHYGTALIACQIIANNAFDGRLALDEKCQQLVDASLDSVLTADVYYFFVGDDPSMCISFSFFLFALIKEIYTNIFALF